MLKLKIESLKYHEGLYFFNNTPYNGIAIESKNQCISRLLTIESGKEKPINVSSLLSDPPQGEHINSDLLESPLDDESSPYTYQNRPFTGVAYTFNNEFLDGIKYIKNGTSEKEISWYKDGNRATFESDIDGIFQEYWWDKNTQLKNAEILIRPENNLSLTFNENGELKSISISNTPFEITHNVKDKLLAPELLDLDYLLAYPNSKKFMLYGNGVTTHIFEKIIKEIDINKINSLSIRNSLVEKKSILKLAYLPNLKELTITSDHDNTNEISNFFRSHAKNCNLTVV